MYDLLLNPNFHLALAATVTAAAFFFWGWHFGYKQGMHDERIKFLSFLLTERVEELTKEQNQNQEQHG